MILENILMETLKGRSLRHLSHKYNLSFTTIYYHVRKKYGKRTIPFSADTLTDKEKGEIMGAFAGDGCYCYSIHKQTRHHAIRIALNKKKDEAYAKHLFSLLKKTNLNPFLIFYKRN